ncbi:MAG: hypothetical protein ACRDV3_08555 [Acidothermaceae bacterium]
MFGDAGHVGLVGHGDQGGVEAAGQPFGPHQQVGELAGRQRPQGRVGQGDQPGLDRVERVDRGMVEPGAGR